MFYASFKIKEMYSEGRLLFSMQLQWSFKKDQKHHITMLTLGKSLPEEIETEMLKFLRHSQWLKTMILRKQNLIENIKYN